MLTSSLFHPYEADTDASDVSMRRKAFKEKNKLLIEKEKTEMIF